MNCSEEERKLEAAGQSQLLGSSSAKAGRTNYAANPVQLSGAPANPAAKDSKDSMADTMKL
jgi:hypothetical protein